ncbi:MAG TPA: alpha/beta hydrolase [Polyangiaceae bacterium]|nr:alpha/beta hydrolase [Polyangiaceae bacterium]
MNYLLLRGLARERGHWHEFAATLATRSEGWVERLDVAGCGTEHRRTPWPSVAWMARDLARRWEDGAAARPSGPWTLIGLSLGGMIALELCRLLPAGFERTVIVNASSRLTPIGARLSGRGLWALGAALSSSDALAREQRILELTSALPPGARQRYAARAARLARERPPSRAAVLAQLLGASRFAPPAPGLLRARLAFICSRGDHLVSPRCTRDLARYYASPLLEHPWAGHDLPLDDPDWLCARIIQLAGGDTCGSPPAC